MNQKYAKPDANGNIIAYYDDGIHPTEQIGEAVKITNKQWADSVTNPGKYVISSGKLVLAPPPSAAQINTAAWLDYQAQAKAVLENSDTVMHRIAEAVILGRTTWTTADVVAFAQWRSDLRAILSQKQPSVIPTTLPTRPAYPAGT